MSVLRKVHSLRSVEEKVIGRKGFRQFRTHIRYPYITLFHRRKAFIVPSQYIRDKLVALGCPKEKIHLIPPGLDINSYGFDPKYKWNSYQLRILNISRYRDKEEMHTLIEAFADLVRTSQPTAKLTIVGDGEGREDLEDLVEYEGLKDHVEFIGKIDSLEEQIKACDLVVLFEENPLIILEVMAMGRILLASNTGGIPELVEDNKTGYLYTRKDPQSLCDKMKYALQHTGDWKYVLLEARKKVVNKHDSRNQVEEIERVYDEIKGSQRKTLKG